jgi:hypothetical protein
MHHFERAGGPHGLRMKSAADVYQQATGWTSYSIMMADIRSTVLGGWNS